MPKCKRILSSTTLTSLCVIFCYPFCFSFAGSRGGQGAGVGVSFDGAVGAFGSWLLLLTIGSFTEASKYQAPSFHEEPPSRVRFLNSSGVVIPCAVQGQPPPRITWIHRDGSEAPTVPSK